MSLMTLEKMQAIIEAAIMIAGHPLSVTAIQQLFPEEERPSAADIKAILSQLKDRYQQANGGIELQEVASGYRFQAKTELSPWLSRLWEERAPRYSRAFLETLVIIAYKQPITRAEIEEIRGVTVSSNIMKTLQERDWIKVIGYREVPGKPAIYGTTKTFLDYFNIKSLSDLPTLAEFKDLAQQEEKLQVQLALENSDLGPGDSEAIPEEREALTTDHAAESNVVSLHPASDPDVENETLNDGSTHESQQAHHDDTLLAIEIDSEATPEQEETANG